MKNSFLRLPVLTALLGNLFEHYDTALYGLLSPFLAPLFFPDLEFATALILTYAIFPLGMVARPLGSLYFGWMGDAKGRVQTVSLTLLAMGLISLLIALLPTAERAGGLAPLLLALTRILQNFFASGETIGGAVYLLESVPERDRDLASSLFNASTMAGILAAGAGVSIHLMLGFSWRILYLLGGITALFGAFFRTFLEEEKGGSAPRSFSLSEVWEILLRQRSSLVSIATAAGFSYASYMVALVMVNALIPLVSAIDSQEMAHLNTALLALDFLLLPLCGLLAYYFSREAMMRIAAASALFLALPLFALLQDASLPLAILVRITFVVIGVLFSATYYSWTQSLVPKKERALVTATGYALGSQLIGGPTAALSIALYRWSGHPAMAGLYWASIGLLTLFVLRKKRRRTLLFQPV